MATGWQSGLCRGPRGEAPRLLQLSPARSNTGVIIHLRQADFTHPLDLPPLDGMLLANSLHFVRHKEAVIRSLVPLLKPEGRLVVVEYNARRSWARCIRGWPSMDERPPVEVYGFHRVAAMC
jgi:SAM-dependent methyltransferase